MSDNVTKLRGLLESLAMMQTDQVPHELAAKLEFHFRDCRLEILRLDANGFSPAQVHRPRQMQNRLEMVRDGHGAAEAIPAEAKRALEAFGWGQRSLPSA